MRMMNGARAREAAPLINFMLMPHCRVAAAGLPLIHLIPFIHSYSGSPLHLAAGSGRLKRARFLGESSLHYAAERGRLETARFLVSAGADLNIQDK